MNRSQLDSLTGAYTRSSLVQQMRQWIEISQSTTSEFSIVIVDLDYFKSINDAFGHQRGDQVLIEVVARMKSVVRKNDQVFRYGGDEFVVLLPGSSKSQAVRVVERMRESIIATPVPGTPPINISATFGLASFPQDSETPESLFAVIDRRLYQGKALGRGRIVHEESESVPGTHLKPPERLVERDLQYQKAQAFLQRLQEAKGGVLQVSGQPGTGRTRFLAEVGKLARLQGYAVWNVGSSRALRFRRGGALAELQQAAGLSPVVYDPVQLAQSFGSWLADKGLDGLLLSLDEIDDVDRFSLEILGRMLETTLSFPCGLVYSGYINQDIAPVFAQVVERTAVWLYPISEQGVHIWLRSSLGWEPPEALVYWYFEQTAGNPKRIRDGIEWMVEQGLLRHDKDGWSVAELDERINIAAAFETQPGKKTRLPEIRSELFGREEELWGIKKIFERNARVVICGPDGIGKSRLALQAAAELQHQFQDGVFWVGLYDRQSREDILFMLAQVWDSQVKPQQISESEVFRLYQGKRVLLVLDNLLPSSSEAAQLMARLASHEPQLCILATALLPLSFAEEHVVSLQGLPFPVGEDMTCADSPSVQLFLENARSSVSDFKPSPEEWCMIARICSLLDGMPLAIELAAVWVSSFSCAQIAERIAENVQFLTGQPVMGTRARPDHFRDFENKRDRSITAVLDGFWQLFSGSEKKVLSALSIFSQGFTAQAARQVADASPFFLDALIAKKMIRVVSAQRYSMHPLLAGYAFLQGEAKPGLASKSRRAHMEYYLKTLAQLTESLIDGIEPGEALSLDLANIQKAWEQASRERRYDLMNLSLKGLAILLFNLGHFLEGMRLFQMGLESLTPQSDSREETWLRAHLLVQKGELYFHIGQYSQGLPVLEEASRILALLDVPAEYAEVLRQLANLVGAMGDYDRALRLLNECMSMVQEESYPVLYFNLLNRAGVMAYFKKDYAQSDAYFERALQVARRMNNPGKITVVLNNRGSVAMEIGDLEQAKLLLSESAALSQTVGKVTLRASVLDSLAKVLSTNHEFQAAAGYFTEALQLVKNIDAVPLALEILTGVAEMWHSTGKDHLACDLVGYIQSYTSVPSDIRERIVMLEALVEKGPQGNCHLRWQDALLPWVIIDVMKILYIDPYPS